MNIKKEEDKRKKHIKVYFSKDELKKFKEYRNFVNDSSIKNISESTLILRNYIELRNMIVFNVFNYNFILDNTKKINENRTEHVKVYLTDLDLIKLTEFARVNNTNKSKLLYNFINYTLTSFFKYIRLENL